MSSYRINPYSGNYSEKRWTDFDDYDNQWYELDDYDGMWLDFWNNYLTKDIFKIAPINLADDLNNKLSSLLIDDGTKCLNWLIRVLITLINNDTNPFKKTNKGLLRDIIYKLLTYNISVNNLFFFTNKLNFKDVNSYYTYKDKETLIKNDNKDLIEYFSTNSYKLPDWLDIKYYKYLAYINDDIAVNILINKREYIEKDIWFWSHIALNNNDKIVKILYDNIRYITHNDALWLNLAQNINANAIKLLGSNWENIENKDIWFWVSLASNYNALELNFLQKRLTTNHIDKFNEIFYNDLFISVLLKNSNSKALQFFINYVDINLIKNYNSLLILLSTKTDNSIISSIIEILNRTDNIKLKFWINIINNDFFLLDEFTEKMYKSYIESTNDNEKMLFLTTLKNTYKKQYLNNINSYKEFYQDLLIPLTFIDFINTNISIITDIKHYIDNYNILFYYTLSTNNSNEALKILDEYWSYMLEDLKSTIFINLMDNNNYNALNIVIKYWTEIDDKIKSVIFEKLASNTSNEAIDLINKYWNDIKTNKFYENLSKNTNKQTFFILDSHWSEFDDSVKISILKILSNNININPLYIFENLIEIIGNNDTDKLDYHEIFNNIFSNSNLYQEQKNTLLKYIDPQEKYKQYLEIENIILKMLNIKSLKTYQYTIYQD